MESIDLKHICRLCAKEDRYCIDVFGEDGSKNSIAKKVRLCLPITIKEDDEYPKQICLTCLSKLDTSYELYSGCMNAQSTIKKLIDIAKEKCDIYEQSVSESSFAAQRQGNLIAQEQCQLGANKPFMKIGNTVVKLQDPPPKSSNSELISEPRMKIRKVQNIGQNEAAVDVSQTALQSTTLVEGESSKTSWISSNHSLPTAHITTQNSVVEPHSTPVVKRSSSRIRHQTQQQTKQKQQTDTTSVTAFVTTSAENVTLAGTKNSYNAKQEGQPNVKIIAPSTSSSLYPKLRNMLTSSFNDTLPADHVGGFSSRDAQINMTSENSVIKSRVHVSKVKIPPLLPQISASQAVINSQKDYISHTYHDTSAPLVNQQSLNSTSVHPVSCVCYVCQKVRHASKFGAFTTTVSAITTTICATKDKTSTAVAKIPTTTAPVSIGISAAGSMTNMSGSGTSPMFRTVGVPNITVNTSRTLVPNPTTNIGISNIPNFLTMSSPLLQQQQFGIMPVSMGSISKTSTANIGGTSSVPNDYYVIINKPP